MTNALSYSMVFFDIFKMMELNKLFDISCVVLLKGGAYGDSGAPVWINGEGGRATLLGVYHGLYKPSIPWEPRGITVPRSAWKITEKVRNWIDEIRKENNLPEDF